MNPKDTELISDDSVLRLTSGEIHVWLAFYDENTEEQLQLAYRELLSSAEREQEARFYFARDRTRAGQDWRPRLQLHRRLEGMGSVRTRRSRRGAHPS